MSNRLEKDYYSTHFSHLYDCTTVEYERLSRSYRFIYKQLLPVNRDVSILDVGCGLGHFLYFLKDEGYKNIFGVDRSEDQLAICRDRVGVSAVNEDALSFLRSNPERFDLITAHNVVEHQHREKVIDFVGAMWDATKAGGKIIITVPNAANPWACFVRYDDLTHTMIFSEGSLLQLFGCLGINKADFYPCGACPVDFWSSLRWLFFIVQEQFYKFNFAVAIGPGRGEKRRKLIVTPAIIAVVDKYEG